MKRLISLPLVFLLSGCPGGNPAPHPRDTVINGDHLCFSIDRNDILNYYTVDTSEDAKVHTVVSSGYNKLSLSYPENCLDIKWQNNHTYVINYGLNGKRYVHQFFIDGNGRVTK